MSVESNRCIYHQLLIFMYFLLTFIKICIFPENNYMHCSKNNLSKMAKTSDSFSEKYQSFVISTCIYE